MMSVYRSKAFEQVISEYFDITHTETRKVLLSVNEADQNQILTSLTSKLYDSIVEKVDDIDFGDIPGTKGDITKLPNYDKIKDCIDTLQNILVQYKQDTKPVDTIDHALENIKLRKDLFEKAYRYNVELPMIVYNTMALSVISAISLMIATSIEFIKTPSQEGFDVTLDKVSLQKVKENILFSNLEKFNQSCKKGDIDNALESVIRNNMKNFTGVEIGVAAGAIAAIGIIFNIIPIIRELIFFFYYSKTRVSEYFDAQADLLQMNAANIDVSKIKTKEEREKIVKKQLKIVEMFRKIANKLSITAKSSEVSATKEIINDKRNMKINDVVDSIPDSASSALF